MNDFEEFNLILAADKANLDDLMNQCPAHLQYKVHCFEFWRVAVSEDTPIIIMARNGFELVWT